MRGVATGKRELPLGLRDLVARPADEGDLRNLLARMTPGQRRAMWLGAFIAIGHTTIADGLRAWRRANEIAPLDHAAEVAGEPVTQPAPVVPIRPRAPSAARDLAAAVRAERDANIVRLLDEGSTPTDVARSVGVSSQRISQIYRKHHQSAGA